MAWLDGGLWLHHTLRISEADSWIEILTLIVPCRQLPLRSRPSEQPTPDSLRPPAECHPAGGRNKPTHP